MPGWTPPPDDVDTSAWTDDDWLAWYASPEAEAKADAELDARLGPLNVCDACDGDGCPECEGEDA